MTASENIMDQSLIHSTKRFRKNTDLESYEGDMNKRVVKLVHPGKLCNITSKSDFMKPRDIHGFECIEEKFHRKKDILLSPVSHVSSLESSMILTRKGFPPRKRNIFSIEKNYYSAKDNIFSLDNKTKKLNYVEKKVENSENLSFSFISTETKKVWNCKHCNHVAMTKSDYWEHLKIHIKEDLRWNCPLCEFITANKYHLMHHIRVHVGSLPTKSIKFVQSFFDKSKLSSHIRSLTEQLKLRNARKRRDPHRLECMSN